MERFGIVWNQLMNDPLGVMVVAVIWLLLLLLFTKMCAVIWRRAQVKRHTRRNLWENRSNMSDNELRQAILREFDAGMRDIKRHLAKQPQ